jgi:hypothetical protein
MGADVHGPNLGGDIQGSGAGRWRSGNFATACCKNRLDGTALEHPLGASRPDSWGRDTLAARIKSRAHARQEAAVTNFANRLPAPQSELAGQLLKDPYLFDFLTLEEPFHERELETGLVRHLAKIAARAGPGLCLRRAAVFDERRSG